MALAIVIMPLLRRYERILRLARAGDIYRLATRLHCFLPYYLSRAGYALPPWHFHLVITGRCNLRCRMCQQLEWLQNTPVEVQKAEELSTAQWLDVVNQLPSGRLVTLTGGEPFVRDDFMALLEAASIRCRTHFISNGVLLNGEKAQRCIELAPTRFGGKGLVFAGISIDGPQEINDAIRGAGVFEKSVQAVRMLHDMRKRANKRAPLLHVSSVIQEANIDTLAEMPRIAADAGADVLSLALEMHNLDLRGCPPDEPCGDAPVEIVFPKVSSPERLATALRDVRRAAATANIEFRLPRMPDEVTVQYYQGRMDLSLFRCEAIWSKIRVVANGDILRCCAPQVVGNVREDRLKDLYNCAAMRAFRRRMRQGLHPRCVGCCNLVYCGPKPR